MTRLLRLLLLWSWLWPLAAHAAIAESITAPRFVVIGDDEVIPEAVVTALAQDRAGFIWIGTPAGLIRYDGYRFRRFEHDANDARSLAGNLVRSLLATADGRLWVGTDVDGVSIYDPARDAFDALQHDPADPRSLAPGAIFQMQEDRRGQVWLTSRGGGLQRVDPGTGKVTRYRRDADPGFGLPSDHVTELLLDRRGRLWVGTAQGLTRLADDGSRLLDVASLPANGLATETVFSMHEASDGRVWLATRGGELLLFDPARNELQQVADADDGGVADGDAAIIYDIREVQPGELWLARSDGIDVRDLQGRLLHRLRHAPGRTGGLAGHDVRALLVDRAGLVWIGGYGVGVQRHDPRHRSFGLLRGEAGAGVLSDPNVSAIHVTGDGEVWLGTRGGGIAVLDAGLHPRHDFPATGSAIDWVTAFAETADGMLWIGSREGLFRHRRGSTTFELKPTWKGAAGHVRRLLAATDGTLWVGGAGGLQQMDADGRLAVQTQGSGPIEGDINAVVEDADGAIWVGSSLGLWRRGAGEQAFTAVHDPVVDPPLPRSVVGLLVDRTGTLWVDTTEGLFRRLETSGSIRFEAVSARDGGRRVAFGASLLDDAEGRIWSAHNVHDPRRQRIYPLTRSDGVDIGTPWFRSYARGPDGRLWFGGSKGVLIVDPSRFQPWDHAPAVVLTDLRIDGRSAFPLPADGALQLTPPQRQFAVEFAALDFTAPDRLRYRYRLHGYDAQWIDSAEGHRVASYGNLWPGDYRLEIQGSNRLGAFSPHTLQIPVRILPAFWQRSVFALTVALLVLLMLHAAVRWRSRRANQRARRLQSLIEQRTAELRRAKEHAEGTLLQLQNTQQQLVAAEKMASLGQLVAGVAHEINTPIGIAVTAASHLREVNDGHDRRFSEGQLSRGDFNAWRESVQEGTRLILGSLERAHTLITGFKQVAVDQSSEQRRPVKLSQFLDEVRVALQPSYRRAGHELQIECADDIELDSYPGALFQILTNLIANSQTHAYDDGQRGRLRIEARADADDVLLTYGDDGRGMSPDVAPHVFEPFFTTRRGSGGSGLGLHLVFNLTTQLLGGTIELRTVPGQGCEFTLRIPRSAPQRVASAK